MLVPKDLHTDGVPPAPPELANHFHACGDTPTGQNLIAQTQSIVSAPHTKLDTTSAQRQ